MKMLRYMLDTVIFTRICKSRLDRCRTFVCINYEKLFSSLPTYTTDLKINSICLNTYLKNLEKEYEELRKRDDYIANVRWIELHSVIQILEERNLLLENLANLKDLLKENDDEIRKLAQEEKQQFENTIKELDETLLDALLSTNKEDSCDSVVLEVQAGVGGQEAMLFAKEIFDMYCNFVEFKGWNLEVAEYTTTDIGGVRYAAALINGKSVFQYFKHEAGIHRVQRIPATEKGGRMHTSTVSVVALPQPTDIELSISPKDLKIETKRSTGAGGQHVNTTDSAVRIVHLPTGIAVECQIERSQIKNRKMAMARLTALLYQKELDSQNEETKAVRKSQVQTRNRNEKIRTYNYSQDRITDHRIQNTIHNLKEFLQGREQLDNLIEKLEKENRLNHLLSIVSDRKQ